VDLVFSGYTNKELAIAIGNGDGTFKATQYYTGGISNSVNGVQVGDINGDGKQDAVLEYFNGTIVYTLLGNGDGSFATAVSYATGLTAAIGDRVFLAEVNQDGQSDIVVSDQGSTFAVLLSNGNGTFKAAVTYVQSNIRIGAVVDVNGDGIPDVIGADSGNNVAEVLLGNGDGTFQARKTFAAGTNPITVIVGDINGDGKLDIVTGSSTDNKVNVLLGNGDGSFKAKVAYDGSSSPGNNITLKDVNGDGFLDAIVPSTGDNSVGIYLGNGDGTFKARTSYGLDFSSNQVNMIDVNGDGVSDLIGVQQGNSFDVLLGNATTTTTAGASDYTLPTFSLTAQSNAQSALTTLSTALTNLETARGQFGAWQSRIQTAISNLNSTTLQDKAAESRIADDDVAADTADLTRRNILQQEGAAVLAQANQMPALALQLLR
jgi:flagellin-like hook-associated protein FlgL